MGNTYENCFEYYIRPVYDFGTSKIVGYQSQQRIVDETVGIIMPEEYMYVAEQSSRCISLAKYWVKGVCQIIASLKEQETEFEWVSVYIPLRFLAQKTFYAQIKELVDENKVDFKKLCFELSPSVHVDRNDIIISNIKKLKTSGVKIAIIDFASEYSAVSQIGDVGEDYLILDNHFAHSALENKNKKEIAQSMVDLAKKLNITMFIDGVDKEYQALMFLDMGCNCFLGDYFGEFTTI